MTLDELIAEAEDVADKAARAQTNWFQWHEIKDQVHPFVDRAIRDAVTRLSPTMVPDLTEILMYAHLYSPGLQSRIRDAAGVFGVPTS